MDNAVQPNIQPVTPTQPAEAGVQDHFGVPFHRHTGLDSPQIQETDILISDNTTNDVSTSKHGFVPKAPNSTTKYLRADGTWSILPVASSIQTYTPTSGGTATLDLSLGNIHHVVLSGNATIAVSNPTTSQCFIVRILQDGSGSRTVTWFTTIKWPGGSAPTLSTGANKADTFGFEVTGSNTYDGFIVGMNL
jgi:hypothetical protein